MPVFMARCATPRVILATSCTLHPLAPSHLSIGGMMYDAIIAVGNRSVGFIVELNPLETVIAESNIY